MAGRLTYRLPIVCGAGLPATDIPRSEGVHMGLLLCCLQLRLGLAVSTPHILRLS